MTALRWGWILIVALGLSCGEDPRSCGAGTIEKDGACVVDPGAATCGAGTARVGDQCVVVDAVGDGLIAADTALEPDVGAAADTSTELDSGLEADTVEAACIPQCASKMCGPDGCGGSCGTCTDAESPHCDELTGKCGAVCVPACVNKNCGPDGCGGACGSCGSDATCQASGSCLPNSWTCKAASYAAKDPCDCECGAPDPDCDLPFAATAGCAPFEGCDANGKCVSLIPAAWTCSKSLYKALDACDCNCGAPDPDCQYKSLGVTGCAGNATCGADGKCAACTPNCAGKQCGDDGCGGFCGLCEDSKLSACDSGKCIDPCKPPVACKYAECGTDGCGGSCGTCATGTKCESGKCKAPTGGGPLSCQGYCGSVAPSGCYCVDACTKAKNCCLDFDSVCACKPACSDKTCGPDGCGGTCGKCGGSAPHCGADGKCTAKCTPKCTGQKCGADGCGGSCGTCAAGDSCKWTGQCVPDAWSCDPSLYGDGAGCTCGCGVGDSDCADASMAVFGCATAKTACSSQGYCEGKLCTSNTQCKNAWCTGVYPKGPGKYGGVCAAPDTKASAPGSACKVGGQCASGVCIGGLCRTYCGQDKECPGTQKCLAERVVEPFTGKTSGFVPVCGFVVGSAATCVSQVACAAKGEKCMAFVEPATLSPRYMCALANGAKAIGTKCGQTACGAGQFCLAKGGCTWPCPGGDSDCSAGWKCGKTAFHNAGTVDSADDPEVSVCVPK